MAKPIQTDGPEDQAERIVEALRSYLSAEWQAAKDAGETETDLCRRCGFAKPGQVAKMTGKGRWERPNLKSILQLVFGLGLPLEKVSAILFDRQLDGDGGGHYRRLAAKFEKLSDRLEAENERLRKRIDRLKAAFRRRHKPGNPRNKSRQIAQ